MPENTATNLPNQQINLYVDREKRANTNEIFF